MKWGSFSSKEVKGKEKEKKETKKRNEVKRQREDNLRIAVKKEKNGHCFRIFLVDFQNRHGKT